MKTKICKLCNIEKFVSEFYTRNDSKDGYRKECKCCRENHRKQYNLKNKDTIAKRMKVYRQENKQAIAKQRKTYCQENKQIIAEKSRIYRQINKQSLDEQARIYNQSPQGKLVQKAKNHKRRMRKIANTLSSKHFTPNDIQQKLKLQKHKCVYCKCSIKDYYEIDHIIALSKGGSNEASNIQLLCRLCNGASGKWDKDATEYAEKFGMLF